MSTSTRQPAACQWRLIRICAKERPQIHGLVLSSDGVHEASTLVAVLSRPKGGATDLSPIAAGERPNCHLKCLRACELVVAYPSHGYRPCRPVVLRVVAAVGLCVEPCCADEDRKRNKEA